jgi:UDP-glucose 4-epimerase
MVRKVVLTGASGYISGLLLPYLRERYDLTLLDVKKENRAGEIIENVEVVDLLNSDRDLYRSFFKGAESVIHCGRRARVHEDHEHSFLVEFDNIRMAYNVYQTCWEEEVKRVVCASSCRATYFYEPLILDGVLDYVFPNERALAESYYGWSKISYEHLGFVFAVGKENGSPLENVQIRIGGPRETDVDDCPLGDMQCLQRALAVYISQRDLAQLFIKSIESDDIRDEQGIPFQIFYGISDNPNAFWSIANARKIIDYQPQDNSMIRFADQIHKHIQAAKEKGSGKN